MQTLVRGEVDGSARFQGPSHRMATARFWLHIFIEFHQAVHAWTDGSAGSFPAVVGSQTCRAQHTFDILDCECGPPVKAHPIDRCPAVFCSAS